MRIQTHTLTLLPPAPGLCQECAIQHEPEFPHKCESLYYQTRFKMEHGRAVTWADAMAHCDEDMKSAWTQALQKQFGIDIHSTDIYGNARKKH